MWSLEGSRVGTLNGIECMISALQAMVFCATSRRVVYKKLDNLGLKQHPKTKGGELAELNEIDFYKQFCSIVCKPSKLSFVCY